MKTKCRQPGAHGAGQLKGASTIDRVRTDTLGKAIHDIGPSKFDWRLFALGRTLYASTGAWLVHDVVNAPIPQARNAS